MHRVWFILVPVVLAVHQLSAKDTDLKLDKNTALNFLHHQFRRFHRTNLREECYGESCRFEEVLEVKSGETAYEYWYDYRCAKFGQNCKVKCDQRLDCSLSEWGKWSHPHGAKLGCHRRTRSRPFNHGIEQIWRRNNCDGLNTHCGSSPSELQSFCICKKSNCDLKAWSAWSGSAPHQGKCSSQTRTRRYAVSYATEEKYNVRNCNTVPSSCPKPRVDTRKTCSCPVIHCEPDRVSHWLPKLEAGKCGQLQKRTVGYSKSFTYSQRIGDCPKTDLKCPKDFEETRTHCMCTYRDSCNVSEWSEWRHPLTEEGCKPQARRRQYSSPIKHVHKANCDGLLTSCREKLEETRTMCKCPRVKCSVGEWGEWGHIPEDTCVTQSRRKEVTSTKELIVRETSCDGVQTTCPTAPEESRKWCNCVYREDCTLKAWGEWKGDIPDVGCGIQVRTRQYNSSLIHIDRASCDDLESCSSSMDETRTKCNCEEVVCKWTAWFKESYDPATKCDTETRVQNVSHNGFNNVERDNSCDDVRTSCLSDPKVEKRKNCGGTSAAMPPTDQGRVISTAPTASVPAKYASVGCFKDSRVSPRPVPQLIGNFRSSIDWYNMEKTVQQCADAARDNRMEYFSVQFFGECYSGRNAEKTFARDGASPGGCWSGVGKSHYNAVYKLVNQQECSDELHEFDVLTNEGSLSDKLWCSTGANQWLTLDIKTIHKITAIGTQGTTENSWVTLYTVEFSEDGKTFAPYKEEENTKVFAGNTDRYTLELHWLELPLEARQIRLRPREWTSPLYCMNVRIFGCPLG